MMLTSSKLTLMALSRMHWQCVLYIMINVSTCSQQPQPNVIVLLLQKGLKDTGKCTQKKKNVYLFSGDVCLQQQMLSAGEVREQRSSFGAERVFPGEASLYGEKRAGKIGFPI